MFLLKATTEVARCGRVGNAGGAQRIEVGFVLPSQFQVLQASRIAQGVVGDVEHVVGFVVWQMELEQVQPLVNGRRQADHLRQLMDQADAAVRRPDGPLRNFILNVGSANHGLRQVRRKIGFVEAVGDSLLASATAIRHNSFHSKSLRECGYLLGGQPLNTAERRRISSFFSIRAESHK